jgi:protein TonB
MFNNLIESSSHAREFKRRGSFVLFTAATYVLLFIVAGVMSIYAYDARLDYQNSESVVMLSPLDLSAAPAPVTHNTPPPRGDNNRPQPVLRMNDFVSINHPEKVPDGVSSKPNVGLPVPEHGTWKHSDRDSGSGLPAVAGPPGVVGGTGDSGARPVIDVGTPPPPAPPVHPPAPRVISKGPITGLAILLPKPPYPQLAKQAGAHGSVNVQVLVDETGKVVSAKAVSGHPLLMAAAVQAAYGARFSPTRLGEQAVKVSGVIVYNFVLQ